MKQPTTSTAPRIWPYSPRATVWSAVLLLLFLLTGFFLLKAFLHWPSEALEPAVLLVVVVMASVPVLLMLVQGVASGGGSLGAFGVRVDFGAVADNAVEQGPKTDVPRNMGAQAALTITGDTTAEVLEAITEFTRNDVAVIDLEDGTAWWETRLAVICAAALRLGKPRAIAFVATNAGRNRQFQGWAEPAALLDALAAAPKLGSALDAAATTMARWNLVYPKSAETRPPLDPTNSPTDGLSKNALFTPEARRRNAPDLVLLHQMHQLEEADSPKTLSIVHLHHLFGAFLHKETLDETMTEEEWLSAVFRTDAEYLAVTRNGRYTGLSPRLPLLIDLFRSLLFPDLRGNNPAPDDVASPQGHPATT